MNTFGEYLRNRREQLGLPLRRVAAELDIDTSILSKIERSERTATKEMLPILILFLIQMVAISVLAPLIQLRNFMLLVMDIFLPIYLSVIL